MNYENTAAFMTGIRKMELLPAPAPVLSEGGIILKIEYVGVCGSDVHFFESGERKGVPFDLPFVLGHECAGTVVETAPGVENVKPGDRVCFEPQITCGKCRYCRSGHYNMCPNVVFPSVPPYNGMLQRYAAIPAQNAFKLPDNVSTKQGALIEPLAVGLSATEMGAVGLGDRIVILGAGCIGLVTMLSAKARGAAKVLIADLFDNRLEKARSLGADVTVNTKEKNIQDAVNEFTDGEGADIVFETAGNSVTAGWTPSLIRRCGTIVMVGNINKPTPIDFMDLMYKEGNIRTIYRYRNNFPTALAAVSSGKIDISGIASHEFPFEETQAAFDVNIDKKSEVTKVVISM